VRLSLPAFTTFATTVVEVRAELDKWVADHLVTEHSMEPDTAEALVAGGWMLPVLDGLDEMDPENSIPERAIQVVAALNLPTGPGPGPVVLSCRTDRYNRLATLTEIGSEPLQDATAIILQPLAAEQVVEWLVHRVPGSEQQQRWRPVLSVLRSHPGGRLARCLSSPLRLYLALTVYQAPNSNPRILRELPESQLDSHLFARLVPAITADRPRQNGTRYDPLQVERWMRTLAAHLARYDSQGATSSDLNLEDLWRSGNALTGREVRTRAMALLAVVLSAMWACSYLLVFGNPGPGSDSGAYLIFDKTVYLVVGVGLVGYNIHLASSTNRRTPLHIELRQIRTAQTRRRVRSSLKEGVKVGPFAGMIAVTALVIATGNLKMSARGLAEALVGIVVLGAIVGVLVGAVSGFLGGLAGGLKAIHASATRPSEPLRESIKSMVLLIVSVGLAAGLAQTLARGWPGAVTGLLAGIPLGFTLSGAGGWFVQHQLYLRASSKTGDLPRDLSGFVDWAYAAGLLRMSGSSTQFRHREVQMHFTVDH
jgi:hypothetical protein